MEKNLDFDLQEIVSYFELTHNEDCTMLNHWLGASYTLNDFENTILGDLHQTILTAGEYMNEEELKAKMVGLIFYVSKLEESRKIMVFYERALSSTIKDVPMSVICDCIVATPLVNAPKHPYFFLQVEGNRNPDEVGKFKKSKGEKKDPEAQMLIAMLIAQHKNNDGKPIYGGYIIGTAWHFSMLNGNSYCVSNRIEATKIDDLNKIIYTLKHLKEIILNN